MTNLLLQELDRIEQEAKTAARGAWPRLMRFLAGFIPAFILALTAAGQHLTLGLILSIAGGTAVMVLGELWPSVPWPLLLTVLDKSRNRIFDPPPGKTP